MSAQKWDSSDRDCKIRGENGEKYNWPGRAILPCKVLLHQDDHLDGWCSLLNTQFVDPGVTTGRGGPSVVESFNVLPPGV